MKKNLLFASALILTIYSSAQYTLTAFSSEYVPIENGTVPAGVFEGWDDPVFETPLGFEITIGSISTNSVQQDGLGASFLAGTFDDGALFGYLSDIIDGAEAEGETPSEITYNVTGTEGNRICKIQYSNAAFFAEVADNGSAANRVNFQIWFYESDFSLEMRFGMSNVPNPLLAYEGISGPTVGLFTGITDDGENVSYAVVLTGDPSSPALQEITVQEDLFSVGLDGTPDNGQVYRFAPTPTSTNSMSAVTEFSVFPNPAIDRLSISGNFDGKIPYRMTDLRGKTIQSGLVNTYGEIDISSLETGVYLLTLNGSSTKKFVKK